MNRCALSAVVVAALTTVGPLATPGSAQPSLSRLQNAPPQSYVWGVSGNGRVVFGQGFRAPQGDPSGPSACIWTVGGCPELAPFQPWALSYDGSIVVGQMRHAVRWNRNTSEILQIAAPGDVRGMATGVSSDGSVVVGKHETSSGVYQAFRWTAQGGIVDIGPAASPSDWSSNVFVSADGLVVVVQVTSGPYRWTESQGAVNLPLSGDDHAWALSADGTAVVGWVNPPWRAFVWREGMSIAPVTRPPWSGTLATGVSRDGAAIAGLGTYSPYGTQPFIWDEAHGARRLLAVLHDEYGINTSGWFELEADGMSADGSTIVGTLVGSQYGQGGWVARLRFCLPDWDTDGTVDAVDFFAFLSDFFVGRADISGDCMTTSADFFEYLNAFLAGCP